MCLGYEFVFLNWFEVVENAEIDVQTPNKGKNMTTLRQCWKVLKKETPPTRNFWVFGFFFGFLKKFYLNLFFVYRNLTHDS